MSGVDSDLIRGHIDTIILKVLSEGDKYGYEICKDVEEKSGGTYELKQPTLYSCLKRLESQGLISSYWEDSDIGGKRHYYKLTDEGKEAYRKNQEDWLRSRQIIDNLISNSHEIASSYSLVKKEEIDEREKKAELAEISEEIKNKEIDADTEHKETESPAPIIPYVTFDDEDVVIPWGETAKEQTEEHQEEPSEEFSNEIADEQEEITYSWNKFVDMSNENEKVLVEVAPNGEETAAYVENIQYVQESDAQEQDDETQEEISEEPSPAQSSIFNDEQIIFEEEPDLEQEDEVLENDQDQEDEDVDILALLGHTTQEEISYPSRELIENTQEELIMHNQELMIEQTEEPMLEYSEKEAEEEAEEPSPFSFNMDDFVTKSKNSYFDSDEDVSLDYVAPTMKVDEVKTEEKSDSGFDFDSFVNKHSDDDDIYSQNNENEDEKEPEEQFNTPVYHDFGASSYNHLINDNKDDENDIYVDTSNVNDDEIYLNPQENYNSSDDNLKLFSEDIFEENNMFEEENNELYDKEESTLSNQSFEEPEIIRENKEPMEFYRSTENYDSISPKFTEDEYKEKLISLMSYTNEKEEYNLKEANYSFNNSIKDYTDLKAALEREGLVVRPHHKMVKESRHTRSYVEANKLNLVNSWTSFGFVSFLITLTYLIMNNYVGGGNASYDFSYKYFLIGIAFLAFIPALYTLLYFINPYKKKPARYASRVYLLFAILLTVQFLLIIYCVNLQMGFYSFGQENYNHLYWIVPSLMSLYPLFDAILHTVYFNSRNFHV